MDGNNFNIKSSSVMKANNNMTKVGMLKDYLFMNNTNKAEYCAHVGHISISMYGNWVSPMVICGDKQYTERKEGPC